MVGMHGILIGEWGLVGLTTSGGGPGVGVGWANHKRQRTGSGRGQLGREGKQEVTSGQKGGRRNEMARVLAGAAGAPCASLYRNVTSGTRVSSAPTSVTSSSSACASCGVDRCEEVWGGVDGWLGGRVVDGTTQEKRAAWGGRRVIWTTVVVVAQVVVNGVKSVLVLVTTSAAIPRHVQVYE
eukprot:358316-Chlamydomonas_euryale.AAC.4